MSVASSVSSPGSTSLLFTNSHIHSLEPTLGFLRVPWYHSRRPRNKYLQISTSCSNNHTDDLLTRALRNNTLQSMKPSFSLRTYQFGHNSIGNSTRHNWFIRELELNIPEWYKEDYFHNFSYL